MTAPARTAAYVALRAIGTGQIDLPTAIAQARTRLTDDRDRTLAAEIVSGTLRWQRSLDAIIVAFAQRPLARLDAEIVDVLRLSLYQLLHLTRVPASAIVDDAVDLARAARKPSATGFVNAVLRTTLRQRNKLPLPARPETVNTPLSQDDRDAALAWLGVTHSHPDWLVARWLDRYGFEAAERWVQFDNETPRLTLRANRLHTTRDALAAALAADDIVTEPTRHAPDGLIVLEGSPLRLPRDGAFVVQDEASQLVTGALDARPGETVLDLCASPGGKTTALAADMHDSGRLIACDVRPRRMRLLQQTIGESGARVVRCVQVPRTGPLPFTTAFDRILVDAPCSGLGTTRRDPDIRWRRTEADFPALVADQLELLERAVGLLRPGGRLVYSTCSSEPEENEAVVRTFLARTPGLTLLDLRSHGPDWLTPLVDADGMFRSTPHRDGLEAFFAAALVREP